MPANNFLPFGTGGGAPVLSQAAYAGITPANGFAPGILPKESLNKALRQGNAMAAALGEFILGRGFDALDDANIAGLAANILSAVNAAADARAAAYIAANYAGGGNQTLAAANGFQKLPGGMVMQWGTAAFVDVPVGTPGGSGTITFPVAFATACAVVLLTGETTSGNFNNWELAVTAKSTTAFDYQIQEWSSSVNPGTLRYVALGY